MKKERTIQFELYFKEFHPPLWLHLWVSPKFVEQYIKLSGADVGYIEVVHNNELTGFMEVGGASHVYAALKRKIGKAYFENLHAIYRKKMVELRKLEVIVHRKKRGFTDAEFADYTEEIYEIVSTIYPMSNFLYVLSNTYEEIVHKKLKNSTIPISDYVHPNFKTYADDFRSALMKLKQRFFKQSKSTIKYISAMYKNNRSFRVAVDKFTVRYQYLTALNAGLRTAQSFFPDIAAAPMKRAPKPTVPASIAAEIDILNYIAFFKDEMSTYVIPYLKFSLISFWRQLADRLGVSFDDFEQLQLDEIRELLGSTKAVIRKRIADRRICSLYYHEPYGGAEMYSGKSAAVLYKKILAKHTKKHNAKNVSIIHGKAGSKGIVTGSVQVISGSESIKKFVKGNILVTAYTAPEFVPIMKKAKAIITDTGGIMSHAAIVSRELGIPCVVGVKIATQVLNDGDRVEVDADRGVITILSKKKKERAGSSAP